MSRFAISVHVIVHLSDEPGLNEDAVRSALRARDSAAQWVIADDIEEALRDANWHPIESLIGGLSIQYLPDPGQPWPSERRDE